MPLLHDVPQYSDAYDALRLGMPTASNFKKIITPLGKPSDSWKGYAYHLIAERCLGRKVETYTSPHMERGLQVESQAVEWYEFDQGLPTKEISFITNDAKTIGCSPDRLVGDEGLLEVKSPAPATQIEYLLTGKVDKAYWPQLQGQLFVSQRKWVDILAWHPELPRVVIRVEREEAYIACIEKQLAIFNDFLAQVMAKIQETINPEKPSVLLAC